MPPRYQIATKLGYHCIFFLHFFCKNVISKSIQLMPWVNFSQHALLFIYHNWHFHVVFSSILLYVSRFNQLRRRFNFLTYRLFFKIFSWFSSLLSMILIEYHLYMFNETSDIFTCYDICLLVIVSNISLRMALQACSGCTTAKWTYSFGEINVNVNCFWLYLKKYISYLFLVAFNTKKYFPVCYCLWLDNEQEENKLYL